MNKLSLLLFSLAAMIISMVSCGGGNDEPRFTDQTLDVGEAYSIPGGGKGWTSENNLIASVSDGKVCAKLVGQTRITNGEQSFKVKVVGKYSTYKEPCLQWGCTKSSVKKFMSGYTLSEEKSDQLTYDGKLKEFCTIYSFEKSSLASSSLGILADNVTADELVGYLNERYIYVMKDEETKSFGFCTPDEKTVVILSVQQTGSSVWYFVYYAPVSASNAKRFDLKAHMQKGFEICTGNTEYSKLEGCINQMMFNR